MFRQLFEQFPLGVVIADTERRVQWVNKAFSDMCGHSLSEIRGRRPGDVLQGAESDPEAVRVMRNALNEGTSCHTQLVNYHKDGHPYWVDIFLRPAFGPDGKIKFYFAVEREVTEDHEQCEAREGYLLTLYDRLSQAMDSMADGSSDETQVLPS